MCYCAPCKVLLPPETTECPHCDSGNLVQGPPASSQGDWVLLPSIPGIVEAQQVGTALEEESIQYYIDQSGATTNIGVGTEKYDRAKEIQIDVLGEQ